ncbi:acyl-CoA synthetase [Rhizobium miluonense]|nr:acyl-CoA synthetase [Rhizobium miluonense]
MLRLVRDSTIRPQISSQEDLEGFERVPLTQRRLPENTYEMLKRTVAVAPDAPALSFFLRARDFRRPTTWTYIELFEEITRAANALRRLGVGRDDVVAFVLPNLPETHLAIWGGEAAGIAFAINPLLSAEHIRDLLNEGNAKWLITLESTPGTDIWEKVSKAAAECKQLEGVLTVGVGRYIGGLSGGAFRILSHARRLRRKAHRGLRMLSFRNEIAKARADRLEFSPPRAEDVSSYFCTGGTTGALKIAKRTHRSEVFDTWSTQNFLVDAFDVGKAIFCGLPLFHVNGQLVTGLAPWSGGAHVVLGTPQGYRGEGVIQNFWKIAEHYRISAFSGVPTVYSALLRVPVHGHDISSVSYGFCGAAPMPVELFRNFETTTGIKILEAYGLTEGACVSSVNPPAGERRIGSIGLRIPYQEMAVVRVDENGDVAGFAPTEEVGVLAIHGPNVFDGYVHAWQSEGIWLDLQGKRWLNTGDLARQDKDGYFWLVGRKKELIIRGGHNIDPKTIESAIEDHPAVQLAAAVGRPDRHAGEIPVLYVQLAPDARASEVELLSHAIARIPERAAYPKSIKILERLPTTAVGKIFKPGLVSLEIEDVVRQEATEVGATIHSLSVAQEPKRGMVVRIEAEGDGTISLRKKLGNYTFHSEFVAHTK